MRRTAFLSTSFIDDNSNPPLYFGSRGSSVRIRPPRYPNYPHLLSNSPVKSFVDERFGSAFSSLFQAQAFHLEPDKNRTVAAFTWAGALGATRLSVQGHSHLVQRRTNGRPILPPAFKQRREQRGETVKIKILGWEKFNEKRKDVKHCSWLRLENKFPQSESLYTCTVRERYVYVALLCLASQRQSAELEFNEDWFCAQFAGGGLEPEDIRSTIRKLNGTVLEHVPSTVRARDVHGTLRTNERTNITNDEEGGSSSSVSDGLVIDELRGLGSDDLFLGMTESAQKSWVRKFGLKLIEDTVPTAYSTWISEKPANRFTGQPTPAVPYVHRWLENAALRGPKTSDRESMIRMLEEHDAKQEAEK